MDYDEEYIRKNPSLHKEDASIKFKEILPQIKKLKNLKSFIDLGCGCGALTKLIYKYLNPKLAVGLDLSSQMINTAKKTGKGKIVWYVGDVQTYVPKKKFDLAICADLIEHLQDDIKALKKISSFTKKLIVRVPLEDSIINKYLKKFKISDELAKTEKKYGHIHHYNTKSFFTKVSKAKLKIDSYELFKINKKRSWWLNESYRRILNSFFCPLRKSTVIKLGGGFLVTTLSKKKW